MRNKVTGPLPVAATALVVGLLAGCGGGHGERHGQPGGDSATAPLSRSELARAAVVTSDVSGYEISESADEATVANSAPRVADARCEPLAAVLGSSPKPEPIASVARTYRVAGASFKDLHDPKEGLSGMARIAAYRGDGAAETLAALRKSASACADGFALSARLPSGERERQRFSAVRALRTPSVGDEAVAYRVLDANGKAGSVVTVVRSGPHLATFFGLNLFDPSRPEVPRALVAAQVSKLEKRVSTVRQALG